MFFFTSPPITQNEKISVFRACCVHRIPSPISLCTGHHQSSRVGPDRCGAQLDSRHLDGQRRDRDRGHGCGNGRIDDADGSDELAVRCDRHIGLLHPVRRRSHCVRDQISRGAWLSDHGSHSLSRAPRPCPSADVCGCDL